MKSEYESLQELRDEIEKQKKNIIRIIRNREELQTISEVYLELRAAIDRLKYLEDARFILSDNDDAL